jgi:hypothetical protein
MHHVPIINKFIDWIDSFHYSVKNLSAKYVFNKVYRLMVRGKIKAY